MIMSTTTTVTPNNSSDDYDRYSSSHHQFLYFSIDLNQDHYHQQYQLQQAAAARSFFSTTANDSATTTTTTSASAAVPASRRLPYHIFIDDVENPDATLSCLHLAADYSWGPPPSFHNHQQQQQKANSIYGDGTMAATEKISGSSDDQMVEAKWMKPYCTTTNKLLRMSNKLTIKPKKYSSRPASSAWDPQKMTSNDPPPSTLQQQQQQPVAIATDRPHDNNSPLTLSSGGGGGGGSGSSPTVVAEAVRVCSDCNTTKTPLWRSGPRGPKSLCNACGIRQRKARRAMAAAAAAAQGADLAGEAVVPLPPATTVKLKSGSQKGKKSNKKKRQLAVSTNSHLPFKKRCKFTAAQSRGRKSSTIGSSVGGSNNDGKLCFEELAAEIPSKSSLSALQSVFPQDEKEAAILLMALSYGLVQS